MNSRLAAWMVTAGLLCGTLGCNVAPMARDRDAPQAPQTSAKSPKGLGGKPVAVDVSVVDAQEVDLVEELLVHRAAYHRYLEALRDYYADHGNVEKQQWAEFELKQLRRVKPFKYLLDAEVARGTLTAAEQIGEANELYEQARQLLRKGGYDIGGIYNRDKLIEAMHLLRDLIRRYPSSDKIDDAAFHLGEIHRDYLPEQAAIAAKWYERAFEWDPNTPHPARLRAAQIHDYRLHDRTRALELYHDVVAMDRDPRNVRKAERRIDELSGGAP